MARRGAFVVLEGLDGAGTTTQTAAVARVLRDEGREVVVTQEPSGGPVGTLLRQALARRVSLPSSEPLTPPTMALLFAADRTDHLAAEILPAVERGAVVLSDRYLLSSLAYQGAQVGLAWVEAVNRFAPPPDLTLFLSVRPAVAASRRERRGGREELYEADEVQRRTRAAYHRAIRVRRARGESIVVVDGARPVDEVTARLVDALRPLLAKR